MELLFVVDNKNNPQIGASPAHSMVSPAVLKVHFVLHFPASDTSLNE
jgi:hypothetical protein